MRGGFGLYGTLLALVLAALPAIAQSALPDIPGLSFHDFDQTNGLVFAGVAKTVATGDGTVLRLVPADFFQMGGAFGDTRVDLHAFSSQFEFRVSDAGGASDGFESGGDGFVFVIRARGSGVGVGGFGLGYEGIGNSVGIEFDTYDNAGIDPSTNHLGFDVDGSVVSTFTADVATRWDDGNLRFVWVDYDGSVLEVRASDTPTRPDTAVLATPMDLATILGAQSAVLGFTASTGGAWG